MTILVVVGAVASYWFVLRKKDTPATPANNEQTTQQASEQTVQQPAAPKPYAVIYKDFTSESNAFVVRPLDASQAEAPLSGTEKATSIKTRGNTILAQMSDSATSAESLALSTDAGKSFTTIYTGKGTTGTGSSAQMGEQITSTIISDDESLVAFAVLTYPNNSIYNVTKVYDIKNKTTKDTLIEKKTGGVFFNAFLAKSATLHYQKGCYNCDGGTTSILYSYDINQAKESIVHQLTPENLYVGMRSNNAVSRLIVSKPSMDCEGPGGCSPYTVEEYDTATKTTKKLATATTQQSPSSGYDYNGKNAYFTNDKTLYTIKENQTDPTVVYTADASIYNVFYFDDSMALFSAGTGYTNTTVYSYEFSSKKITEIKKLSGNMQVLGLLVK